MLDPKSLAEKIRFYRRREGMTQTDLADKIYVSFQAISSWECGSTLPDVENLCNLARVFNVSVDELLQKKEGNEETFMIGIDAGGTSTEFALFSSTGHIIKTFKLPGSNSSTIGVEASLSILFHGIDLCVAEDKPVSNLFLGIAGGNYKALLSGLKERYPNINIRIDSDGLSALYSAEGDVALICGTGSILLRKIGDEFKTIGGWGHRYSDPGSAYNFGREALRVGLLYEDGGDTSTFIYCLTKEKAGITTTFLEEAPKMSVANVAKLAHIIFEAYKSGDKEASIILNNEMRELAKLISVACPNGGRIIACGGIMEHFNDIIIPCLKKHVPDNIEFVLPELPPIYGSCKACFELFSVQASENFFENFYKEYNSLNGK